MDSNRLFELLNLFTCETGLSSECWTDFIDWLAITVSPALATQVFGS